MSNIWEGKFGNDYNERNRNVDENILDRIKMFDRTFNKLSFMGSILEVGCGQGANLAALSIIKDRGEYPILRDIKLIGLEPNADAVEEANTIPDVSILPYSWSEPHFMVECFDMVFTSGVLIHIPREDLKQFMSKIVDTAKQYVVAIEYFSPETRMIPYRGQDNALWSDDYGRLYEELGLKIKSCEFYYKPLTGLDNVTVWVMEK